ncbi:MAG TPA: tetratricopeptide repeat protein [Candidatus Acidoferrum sp.]
MPKPFARSLALLMIALLLASAPQSWATCGGGGGGGMGGMSGGGSGAAAMTYRVPWRVIQPTDTPPSEGLLLYWFPTSQQELEKSSLNFSRDLSVYATQCVTLGILDARTNVGQKFVAGEKLPVAVLAQPDGTIVAKAQNKDGFLRVGEVEKIVNAEMKKRQDALKEKLDDAKNKAKSGDNPTAIEEYRAVLGQKCLFPNKAKDAVKALKKLGVNDVAEIPDAPILDPAQSAKIESTMNKGLVAENASKFTEAERLYREAHRMDPADPTPLRYLGELYRHHIGDWDKARASFDAILAMPADPLSRAVALHGLGKMTIHEGDFKKGLSLIESSVQTYPLPLAYRNLAVYWNSEGDTAKADAYTKKALALDPTDPYNLIFAAAFMAGTGHGDEALKIARENESLLPASYNLAAIYAQTGQREKALALLQRHFFQYERYESVRTKEMMEARVDAVFATLRDDKSFLALTSLADGKLPMPMPKPAAKPVSAGSGTSN